MIRDAGMSDAAELLGIHAQYIDTAITFERELPTAGEFASRVLEITERYPYLVYVEDGRILGYAYAHRFREREAYSMTAELSVYVDKDSHGRGIAAELYTELFKRLKEIGVKKVISVITLPNGPSVRLHERFGFEKEGELKAAGRKNSAYWSVGYYSKFLTDEPPLPERTPAG